MGFSVAARNVAADTLGGVALRASLHIADPGATGANEVAGGTYSRLPVAWDPAVAGIAGLNGPVVFNVPAGTTITHVGLWRVDGTWLGSDDVTPTSYTTAGVYTLDTASTVSVA